MNLLGGRRYRTSCTRTATAGLLFLALGNGVGNTQHPGTLAPDPTLGQVPDVTNNKDKDKEDPFRAVAARQAKMREEERQKRLVSDTDKLLALVTQLHEDVAKTNKNILSIDVVRKADEIEKLARSVKERMKD